MLWLWNSTGWGLKSIHPLKSHCTKAFKSYSITAGRDSAAPLMPLRLLWPLQPLHSSRTSTVSPPVAVRHPSIYPSFHILSLDDAPWEEREESLQHREQVTKNGNYVLQWSTTDETGAGVALKPQDTEIHTVRHKEKWQEHTRVRTVRATNTKEHMDCVQPNDGSSKLKFFL